MTVMVKFEKKEMYDLARKYLGDPPCENCIRKPFCFVTWGKRIDEEVGVVLKKECLDGKIWYRYAVSFEFFIPRFTIDGKIKADIKPENIRKFLKDLDRKYSKNPTKPFLK
jgi:hypothetical protein